MKGLPYFRWYPADAETDSTYAAMTWAERGFYHWCLNYSWINNGLPGEDSQIARVARMSPRDFQKLWIVVGRCFTNVDGSYRNRRQEEERTYATTKSERATASVRTRYERSTNVEKLAYERTTDDLPRALARESESESESDTKAETHTHKSVRAALPNLRKPNAEDLNRQTSPNFEAWFTLWAGVRGNAHRAGACQAYISTVLLTREADAMACTGSYIAGPGADPAHGYRPDNFLFEMARDGFQTRWPAQRAGPQRQETPTESAIRKAKEAKNGTR
jgi:uncharacterized protein YdaU (DUF1376 family)